MNVQREAGLVALFVCALSGRAYGQPAGAAPRAPANAQEIAKQLDAEGTAEMDAGDLAGACPKLAESYRLDQGIGVLLRLALCYERSGKVASARKRYSEAADVARRGGNAELRDLALRRAGALEPMVPKMTLHVREVEGLRITVDGETLARDAWNAPVPIDPGAHEVVATAPGMRRFVASIHSADDPRAPLSVDVALEAAGAKPAQTSTDVGPHGEAPAPLPHREAPATQGESTWQRPAAIALGVLGAAGLVTGGIFGATAISSMNTARDQCPTPSTCPGSAIELQNNARSSAAVSTVAFAVGAAAVAGGLVLWLTAPHGDEPRAAWRIEPLVERNSAGIGCTGAF